MPAAPVVSPAERQSRPSPSSLRPSAIHHERRAARLLRALRDRDLLRRLGYVRLGDYVIERLGVSYRTAQEWMRVDDALETAPLVAATLEAGRIHAGHARLLTRVVTPGDEARWVELARKVGVSELGQAVAEWRKEQEAAGGNGRPQEGPGGGLPGGPCDVPRDDVVAGSRLAEDEADDPPESERIELEAPAWLAHTWRDTVTFARQLSGAAVSRGACFEMVLAELRGSLGVPDDGVGTLHERAGARGAAGSAPAVPGAGPLTAERDGKEESAAPGLGAKSTVPTSSHARNGGDLLPSAPDRVGTSKDADLLKLHAQAIDDELLDLMAARQRRDWTDAERLRAVAASRTYQLDGFTSLAAYARERMGLPPRRVYLLLALHRTLERLPGLRASFLTGRVSLKQALLVGSVATVVTELAWIGRARSVTLRRLEDEICFWKHLEEIRPKVWDLLEGGPQPDGIVLVPGRPARLSSSAPASAAGETARAFLRALEEGEKAVPLPEHQVVIRLRVEPAVLEMWESTLAHCRAVIGESITAWEVLALALDAFWMTWDNKLTRRQRRENPTLDRDGWRCMVPGCRSIGTGKLHEHHIRFRSQGGALADPQNLVTMCTAHHHRLLHHGFIRCSGEAPDDLEWALGVGRGHETFLIYRGETRVAGAAR